MNALPFMSDVPAGWKIERLDRLFRQRKEPAHDDDPLVSAYIDGVVTLRSNRPEQITKSSGYELGYQHVEVGDLVISGMNAHLGGLGIAEHSGKCTPVYVVLEPVAEMDQRFISRYLRLSAQSGYIKSLVNAVRYNSSDFRPETIKSMYVPLPPLEEQRRIADFLDDQVARIDFAIAVRGTQGGLLREALISEARTLTSGSGQAWKVSHAFQTGSGTTPKSDRLEYFDGEFAWVNSGDLNDGHLERTANKVTMAALTDYSALKLYEPGALLVAMYGATVGRVARLDIAACVNQAVCVLRPLGPISIEYAHAWFLSRRADIVELASGGGQPNISQEVIRGLRIDAGDARWQAQRVAAVEVVSDEIAQSLALMEDSIQHLRELQRSLISAAVSGEFDVSASSGRGVSV